MAAGVSADN